MATSDALTTDEMTSEITAAAIAEWLLADGDRCVSVIDDAYAAWDPDVPWRKALLSEIEYRRKHP